jgi:hypothetical protein
MFDDGGSILVSQPWPNTTILVRQHWPNTIGPVLLLVGAVVGSIPIVGRTLLLVDVTIGILLLVDVIIGNTIVGSNAIVGRYDYWQYHCCSILLLDTIVVFQDY